MCPPNFEGDFCETDVEECVVDASVCKNGANCINTNGSFYCKCDYGWTGDDCNENIDDCENDACFNGATCIDGIGNFSCQCTPGRTGLYCQFDDVCFLNPCHNYAICEANPFEDTYICTCSPGYIGTDCSEDINECNQGK